MSQKVWIVKFVVGNPEMFSQVRQSEPLRKSDAIVQYLSIPDDWRKWIENVNTGKRLKENDVESSYRN